MQVSKNGKIDENATNFMLSVIKAIKPKDQLEAMLPAQIAAVLMATMTLSRRLAGVENIPKQHAAERALNNFARTYAGQMEALKRYRTCGEQKVTVQHVSVNEGGLAIVGNVTQAARQNSVDKPLNSMPTLTDARQAQMPILDDQQRASSRRKRNGK